MQVRLTNPLPIAGRTLVEIELRTPGRRAFDAMARVRPFTGFSDNQAVRFGARLSGHSELTMRRLSPADLAVLRSALDELFSQANRRFQVRAAIAAGEARNA